MAVSMRRPGLEEEAQRAQQIRAARSQAAPPPSSGSNIPPIVSGGRQPATRPTVTPTPTQGPQPQVSIYTGSPQTTGVPRTTTTGLPNYDQYRIPSDFSLGPTEYSEEVRRMLQQLQGRPVAPPTVEQIQQSPFYQAQISAANAQEAQARAQLRRDLAARGQLYGTPAIQAESAEVARFEPVRQAALAGAYETAYQQQQREFENQQRLLQLAMQREDAERNARLAQFQSISRYQYMTPSEIDAAQRAGRLTESELTGVDPVTGQPTYATRRDNLLDSYRRAEVTGYYFDPEWRPKIEQVLALKERTEQNWANMTQAQRAAASQQAEAMRRELPPELQSILGANVTASQARQNFEGFQGIQTMQGRQFTSESARQAFEDELRRNPEYGDVAYRRAQLQQMLDRSTDGITPYQRWQMERQVEADARTQQQSEARERSDFVRDMRTEWNVGAPTLGIWYDFEKLMNEGHPDGRQWTETELSSFLSQMARRAPTDSQEWLMAMWTELAGGNRSDVLSRFRRTPGGE